MENTPMETYITWSHADLVRRITTLESQIRSHIQQTPLPSTPKKLRPKKPAKSFDPTRYHTRHIALKFAYLGSAYNGFEHHSNNTTPLPTIEEELWKALMKVRLIFPEWKEGQSQDEVCWNRVDYSKCGRTDRGVSAFGQVVGLRVRSARPKVRRREESIAADEYSAVAIAADSESSGAPNAHASAQEVAAGSEEAEAEGTSFDSIRDELPYIQLINRVLPSDIRVLAWCPYPPRDFSARFNCKERRYRYFFTNPAFMPLPGDSNSSSREQPPGEAWLDIEAMNQAARKYEGLHDFRNFCKVDPSKQITNFERRIFHAGVHEVHQEPTEPYDGLSPKLYYFEVRGSAFLWHQVRHLVAMLFLVGQGYEKADIIDDLLNVEKYPSKPMYEMASDVPLVLWDCIFPDAESVANADHSDADPGANPGYQNALDWVYVGDEVGGRDWAKRSTTGVEDGKHGRNGMMEDLWALWRKQKMDEVLAWGLMDVVSAQGKQPTQVGAAELLLSRQEKSARLFDGSEKPRAVGDYVPIAHRERMDTPEVVNARYLVRKGLNGKASSPGVAMDE